MDYDTVEFFGIDPNEFKDMKRKIRTEKQTISRQEMIDGIKEPNDKNFNSLKNGDIVYINVSMRTPILKGRVRMAFAKDSYVIEHETLGVISWDDMVPGLKITSTKPYIFDISIPNHTKVFLTMKELELSHISFLFTSSKNSKTPVSSLVGKIHELLEKYPEEFI